MCVHGVLRNGARKREGGDHEHLRLNANLKFGRVAGGNRQRRVHSWPQLCPAVDNGGWLLPGTVRVARTGAGQWRESVLGGLR